MTTELQDDPNGPAVHNISLIGITGAIFACVAIGLILFCEAFVSSCWLVDSNNNSTYVGIHGLWSSYWTRSREFSNFSGQGWFMTSQILFSAALFGFVICFILAVIYLSANKASKNLTISALVFVAFLTVSLLLSGLILFGVMMPSGQNLHWSYILSVVAGILLLLAGILTIVQIKKSNVRLC